ncbi:ATX10 protein, partial [Atractosteus spatula]|nr:ATX10 protein [Atractosteus spatula]
MAAPSAIMLDLDVSLSKLIEECSSRGHLEILQNLTKAFREQEFRAGVQKSVFQSLQQILSKLSKEIHAFRDKKETEALSLCLQMTAECFRIQRNACVQCARNQCLMSDLSSHLPTTLNLNNFKYVNSELLRLNPVVFFCLTFPVLRCGIQFLGNFAVGNQVCKDDVWKHGFPHLFLTFLDHSDEKTVAYCSMVLHTCLDAEKVTDLVLGEEHQDVAMKVISLCRKQPELDWPVLIVTQHFLKSSELVEKMFARLNNQERITLLELVMTQLGEEEEAIEESGISGRLAKFFASCFEDQCKAVLTLASDPSPTDEGALFVMGLLDVLCEMTSDRKKFMFLQNYSELLKTTVELLKEVHFVGKASRNVFTATHDFSELGASGNPAMGFKAHLIRLIGNLCHHNRSNQDKVRELDGIALLLDNCNIDGNNPFISQWAIFAVRNVLDQNEQNQEVLRALEGRGVADDSALREMGFRLEDRDGSLLLRPFSSYSPPRNLCSSDFGFLRVATHSVGHRAFSCCTPKLWNSVPKNIRETPSLKSFQIHI